MKLQYDETLSNFAFNVKLRRYNKNQTVTAFFELVTRLWPHLPRSSRSACFNAIFANVQANETYINENVEDRRQMPTEGLVHVMSRWNLVAWHQALGRERALLANHVVAIAAMLHSW